MDLVVSLGVAEVFEVDGRGLGAGGPVGTVTFAWLPGLAGAMGWGITGADSAEKMFRPVPE